MPKEKKRKRADAESNHGAEVSSAVSSVRWVARPLEPVVTNGRGMHFMGFAPPGGFQTTPITISSSSTSAPQAQSSRSEDVSERRGSIRGPTKWKHGRPVFEHGNYSEYYGYRLARPEQLEDPRLDALRTRLGGDVFSDKSVLDIGCNAGLVSIAVSQHGAKRVVGIDIDANLIDAARNGLSSLGDTSVEFRAEDILQSPLRRPPEMLPERFDIVLCFSMTKWVHFANGDQGIRSLFKRCWKRLNPGGLFVLEAQDWASYKKKRHLTPEIRQQVSNIQMPPDTFKAYLVSLGFEFVGKIKPTGEVIKGFSRPIRLFKKPCAETASETCEKTDATEGDTKKAKTGKKDKKLVATIRESLQPRECPTEGKKMPKISKPKKEEARQNIAIQGIGSATARASQLKTKATKKEKAMTSS